MNEKIKEKLNRAYLSEFSQISPADIPTMTADLENVARFDKNYVIEYLIKTGFVSAFQPNSSFAEKIFVAVQRSPELSRIAKETQLSFWKEKLK